MEKKDIETFILLWIFIAFSMVLVYTQYLLFGKLTEIILIISFCIMILSTLLCYIIGKIYIPKRTKQ